MIAWSFSYHTSTKFHPMNAWPWVSSFGAKDESGKPSFDVAYDDRSKMYSTCGSCTLLSNSYVLMDDYIFKMG